MKTSAQKVGSKSAESQQKNDQKSGQKGKREQKVRKAINKEQQWRATMEGKGEKEREREREKCVLKTRAKPEQGVGGKCRQICAFVLCFT